MYLRSYDGDVTDLDLNFTVMDERFGETKVTELVPGGQNVAVTNENRVRCVLWSCACLQFYFWGRYGMKQLRARLQRRPNVDVAWWKCQSISSLSLVQIASWQLCHPVERHAAIGGSSVVASCDVCEQLHYSDSGGRGPLDLWDFRNREVYSWGICVMLVLW